MADNNFRAHRGRDPLVRDDDNSSGRDAAYNPLAELARLIGQADPVPDYAYPARSERHVCRTGTRIAGRAGHAMGRRARLCRAGGA